MSNNILILALLPEKAKEPRKVEGLTQWGRRTWKGGGFHRIFLSNNLPTLTLLPEKAKKPRIVEGLEGKRNLEGERVPWSW